MTSVSVSRGWAGGELQKETFFRAPRDAQSVGILEFNDMVAADSRFRSIMLPLRDGVTLAVRQ